MELDAIRRAVARKAGKSARIITLRWRGPARLMAVVCTARRVSSAGPGWGIVDLSREDVDRELVKIGRRQRKERRCGAGQDL